MGKPYDLRVEGAEIEFRAERLAVPLQLSRGPITDTTYAVYCWARRHHLYITIQDLTNPGRALVHSANLASYLALAYNDLECNSRQYMPAAAPAEQAAYRPYF
ncbi:MAG: hypothetical protein KGS73_12420 [Chloroflexi bacterium]|nr:hypothetical protein [Chloroflexota bacterium]